MRVKTLQRLRLVLLLSVLSSAWGCATTVPPAAMPLRSPTSQSSVLLPGPIRTIVLDPGHGGHDPGTSHFGLKEKHLTLDIAKRLRALLEQDGLHVILTRETDQFIPLSRRPAIANHMPADLFVSVHINANRNRRVSGIEVYYPRQSIVSPDAQWPPSVAPEEVGVPSMTIKEVLWDMVLARTRTQSRRLASSICHSMHAGLPAACEGVKPARFVVLREAWMPAVLVEVGYVTNRIEAGRLGKEDYRQATAQSIERGILTYIRDLGAEHI